MVANVILDTNVFIAALRSRRGASFQILSMVGTDRFDISLSVPLVVEYEAVAKRQAKQLGLSFQDIDDILDYLCQVAKPCDIYFLWRPFLRDPKDDFVLEAAIHSEADYIVTHNLRDFEGAQEMGVNVITPQQFLQLLGEAR
jgi:putative PIN family toxin of toxin-antitoxin system